MLTVYKSILVCLRQQITTIFQSFASHLFQKIQSRLCSQRQSNYVELTSKNFKFLSEHLSPLSKSTHPEHSCRCIIHWPCLFSKSFFCVWFVFRMWFVCVSGSMMLHDESTVRQITHHVLMLLRWEYRILCGFRLVLNLDMMKTGINCDE